MGGTALTSQPCDWLPHTMSDDDVQNPAEGARPAEVDGPWETKRLIALAFASMPSLSSDEQGQRRELNDDRKADHCGN